MQLIQTDYLDDIFYPRKFPKTVAKFLTVLRKAKREKKFDAIAFTGTSGSAMAYIAAHTLKVGLMHIRKADVSSHYYLGAFEGMASAKRFIIVDDFIGGGNTVKRILAEVKVGAPQAQCVGIALYAAVRREKTFSVSGKKIPIYK